MRFSVTTPVLLAASLAITSSVSAAPTGSPKPAAVVNIEHGSPRLGSGSPNLAIGNASPFGFPGMFMGRRSPALKAAGSRRPLARRRSFNKREDAEPVEDVSDTLSKVVDSGLGLGLGLGLPVPSAAASTAQGAPSTASSTVAPAAFIPLSILQNVLPAWSVPFGVVHAIVIPATGVPIGIIDNNTDTPSVLFKSVSSKGSPIFSAVPLSVIQGKKATAQTVSSNILDGVLDKIIPAVKVPMGTVKSTVVPAAGVPIGVIKSKAGTTDVLFETASDKGPTLFNMVPLSIVQSQSQMVGSTFQTTSSTVLSTALGKVIPMTEVPLGMVRTTVIPTAGIPLGVINSKKDTPEVLFQTIGSKGKTVYNAVPLSVIQGTATSTLSSAPVDSPIGTFSGLTDKIPAPIDPPVTIFSGAASKLSHVVRSGHQSEQNSPSVPPNSPSSPAEQRQRGRYAPWAFAPYDHTPAIGAFIDLQLRSVASPPMDLPNPWPVMNGVVDISDECTSPVSCDEDGFALLPAAPSPVAADAAPVPVGSTTKGAADRTPVNAASDSLPSPPAPPAAAVTAPTFPGSPNLPLVPPNSPFALPASGSTAPAPGQIVDGIHAAFEAATAAAAAAAKKPAFVPVQAGKMTAGVMPEAAH